MAKILQIVRRIPSDTLPHRESDLKLIPEKQGASAARPSYEQICVRILAASGAGELPIDHMLTRSIEAELSPRRAALQ